MTYLVQSNKFRSFITSLKNNQSNNFRAWNYLIKLKHRAEPNDNISALDNTKNHLEVSEMDASLRKSHHL